MRRSCCVRSLVQEVDDVQREKSWETTVLNIDECHRSLERLALCILESLFIHPGISCPWAWENIIRSLHPETPDAQIRGTNEPVIDLTPHLVCHDLLFVQSFLFSGKFDQYRSLNAWFWAGARKSPRIFVEVTLKHTLLLNIWEHHANKSDIEIGCNYAGTDSCRKSCLFDWLGFGDITSQRRLHWNDEYLPDDDAGEAKSLYHTALATNRRVQIQSFFPSCSSSSPRSAIPVFSTLRRKFCLASWNSFSHTSDNLKSTMVSAALGVPRSGSAAPSNKALTTAISFLKTAPAKGDWLRSFSMLGFAPCAKRSSTRAAWPW